MKKLYEGSGNLIRRVENIKQLGAKSTKSLPDNLLGKGRRLIVLKITYIPAKQEIFKPIEQYKQLIFIAY